MPKTSTHSEHTNIESVDFKGLKLLGHRGARHEYLENSMEGFTYLQSLTLQLLSLQSCSKHQSKNKLSRQTIHGVEFDVQLTADNQLVVFHDDNLSRIYGLQSRVDQLSLNELKKVTEKSSSTKSAIMTLDELYPLLQGYHHIELEIKTHNRSNLVAITKALRQHALSQYAPFNNLPITLTSFDTDLHGYIQRCPILSRYPRGLLIGRTDRKQSITKRTEQDRIKISNTIQDSLFKTMTDDTLNLASRLGCTHLGFDYTLINEYTVDLCHRHDFTLSAWTVNNVKSVHQLNKMGVDYIITDYPTFMSSLY